MTSLQNFYINTVYLSKFSANACPPFPDLQTQAGYQQMDSHFIGLIFSVYNEDKKTKVQIEESWKYQLEILWFKEIVVLIYELIGSISIIDTYLDSFVGHKASENIGINFLLNNPV